MLLTLTKQVLTSNCTLQDLWGITMQDKQRLNKLHTQYTLIWCLKIGEYLGTLNIHALGRLLDVKSDILRRWMAGKQVAPEVKLSSIKTHALAPYRSGHRKKMPRSTATANVLNADLIETKYLWRIMLFDEMSIQTKRRYCKRLKKDATIRLINERLR